MQVPFIFVQARMSSARLPGKSLMRVHSKVLLEFLVDNLLSVWPKNKLAILTSLEISDDAIEEFCLFKGISIYRGSLDNVYERYLGALVNFKTEYFFRICADSPYIPAVFLSYFFEVLKKNPNTDLITNVADRPFPKGYSLELIRTQTFQRADYTHGSSDVFEHVTMPLYSNKYRIVKISTTQTFLNNYAIDSRNDYERLKDALDIEKIDESKLKVNSNDEY